MDIPTANCVIRFDSTQSSVPSPRSYVAVLKNQAVASRKQIAVSQGRGYFPPDNDVKVEVHEADEKPVLLLPVPDCKQPEHISVPLSITHSVMSENSEEKLKRTQTALEINGKASLEGNADPNNCMAKLRAFCERTKTPLESIFKQQNDECYVCLKYQSVLRSCTANGRGPTRTKATIDAALQLVVALRYQVLSEYANI